MSIHVFSLAVANFDNTLSIFSLAALAEGLVPDWIPGEPCR